MVYNKTDKFYRVRRYNSKTKIYPDGTKIATYSNRYIFAPASAPSARSPCTDIFDVPLNYFDDLIFCLKNPFSLHLTLETVYSPFLLQNKYDLYDFLTEEQYSELYCILLDKKTIKSADKKSKCKRSDNVRRTQQKIYDLVSCNDWDYFFTGTLGDTAFDPASAKEAVKPLQTWLSHMQQRKGLKYILIAEYQKNGRIHFHGFINDVLTTVDSGTRLAKGRKKPVKLSTLKRLGIDEKDTQIVYNIPEWRFGFTTAVKPQGTGLYSYITKYITKDNKAIFGRYYWSSRNLTREPDVEYSDVDFESIITPTYSVPKTEICLKYYTFFPGQTDFHYNLNKKPDINTILRRWEAEQNRLASERFEKTESEEINNGKK